MVKKF
jgi:hypothetical protein